MTDSLCTLELHIPTGACTGIDAGPCLGQSDTLTAPTLLCRAVVAADAPQPPGHALPACVVPCDGLWARAAGPLRDDLGAMR